MKKIIEIEKAKLNINLFSIAKRKGDYLEFYCSLGGDPDFVALDKDNELLKNTSFEQHPSSRDGIFVRKNNYGEFVIL